MVKKYLLFFLTLPSALLEAEVFSLEAAAAFFFFLLEVEAAAVLMYSKLIIYRICIIIIGILKNIYSIGMRREKYEMVL